MTSDRPPGASSHAGDTAAPSRPLFSAEFPEALLALLAVAVPLLLAWNVPPSSTFLNQALAIGGWGAFIGFMFISAGTGRGITSLPRTALFAVTAVLVLIAMTAVGASVFGTLPASLSWSATGMLAAALITVWSAAVLTATRGPSDVMLAFCFGLLAAGVLSAGVALVQVFAPAGADGVWIAAATLPGRAAGNLRQPNHLSSLTLWALVALAWLADGGRVPKAWAALLGALLVASVVLSFSRTGTIGILMLGAWGLAGRRLSRPVRWGLVGLPVLYAIGWWVAAVEVQSAADGVARFSAQGDVSSSRFAIWSNTLALIQRHPWTGVGFGSFNFAWTLTPFPDRPVAFFDHTHNLPLQLAVELGIPMAILLLALLLSALWQAARAAVRASVRHEAVSLQAAFMLVLLVSVHSLLEYPLWYAYFLLPAAFAFGVCLAGASTRAAADPGAATSLSPAAPVRWLRFGAVLMAAGAIYSVVDYWRIVVIFAPGPGAGPLSERIEAGKRSLLFAHHAHYAAATNTERPAEAMASFKSAGHFLLDTRLMMAWATAYHDLGDDERAHHLADRLREFHNAVSQSFLGICSEPAAAADPPFQCIPAKQVMDERDFR